VARDLEEMSFEDLTIDIAASYSAKIAAHIKGFESVLFEEGVAGHQQMLATLYQKKQVSSLYRCLVRVTTWIT
jgi:hypothetical protein